MRAGAMFAAVVAAAAVMPVAAMGQSGQVPSKAEIQKMFGDNLAHRNAGHLDRYLELYTADATQLYSDGTLASGRAEMQKRLQQNFASGVYKGAQTKSTVESVQSIAPGVLLVDSTWELTNIPGGGSRKGHVATIMVKSGATWKIAAERNMVPRPAGALNP